MKDRVVQYPNRYKLMPVSGTSDTYDFEAVPGTVTEDGSDINKANLLTDTVASLINTLTGTTPTTPNGALSALTSKLQTLWNERVQIATGSYTGIGVYGVSNPNSLTFDFAPKLLIIKAKNGGIGVFLTEALTDSYLGAGFIVIKSGAQPTAVGCFAKRTDSNKTISWYNTFDATGQFNENAIVQDYVVIG